MVGFMCFFSNEQNMGLWFQQFSLEHSTAAESLNVALINDTQADTDTHTGEYQNLVCVCIHTYLRGASPYFGGAPGF